MGNRRRRSVNGRVRVPLESEAKGIQPESNSAWLLNNEPTLVKVSPKTIARIAGDDGDM